MADYILKSALVAEIERWIELLTNEKSQEGVSQIDKLSLVGRIAELQEVKVFINTFEVKEVKEPTASDRGMAEEIIINLKRVEQDYHIDLTREMEWLRNQVKKGE